MFCTDGCRRSTLLSIGTVLLIPTADSHLRRCALLLLSVGPGIGSALHLHILFRYVMSPSREKDKCLSGALRSQPVIRRRTAAIALMFKDGLKNTIKAEMYKLIFRVIDEALVFRVHARETLTTHHERQNGDTRLEHELVWETNTYGDVTKAVRAQYGKAKSDLYTANARAAQRQHYIIYTENEFTKDIVGRDVDSYCTPLPASKTISVIEDSPKSLLNIDSLRSRGLESIGGSLKVGQQTRTYYISEDLSTRLPLGSREVYSIVDQHYQLALNAAMCKSLASVEGISVREIAIPSYLHDSCGYEQLNEDGCAWVPSPKVLWGSDEDSDGSAILNQARRSFLIPMRSSDAFGNTASVKLDEYSLFAVESTDAVKNVTTAEYDYRTVQAALNTDANGNRTQVKYDQFGEATMVARMGKVNEAVGDSLEDVPHSVSDEEVLSFISSPTQNAAANLLGSAGVRTLSCRNRLALTSVQKTLPTFRLELSRTQHFRDDQGDIAVKISYLDGHGTQVQQLSLSDWNGTEMQWCVTKHNVLDTNGKKLLSAKPYISPTHLYQSLVDSNQAYDIFFLDVLQREVGTLFADRTWKKSRTTPWMRTDYDVGCNVLVSNPRLDPDVGFYFSTLPLALHTPTWHAMRMQGDEAQRDATTKSAGYGNNPHEAHFDSRGKEVEKVEKSKTSSRKSNVEYDAFGNAIAEADFLGRSVVRREFDYLGRCHITRSMDAGVQLVCFDVLGNTAFQCSSNKCQQRTVYDGLRRKVETWMLDASRDSEALWSKTTYGDSGLGGDQKNLRGRVLEVSDQAGTRRNGVYDFKGNCLSINTYIAQTYDVILDWSSNVDVQQTPYTTLRTFDAMNRITTLTDAAGRVSVRTFDLRGNMMSLFSSTESQPSKSTCHILSAVYSAEQQPLLVNYGNSSHAAYTYDEQTRRLTQRRTWRDDGTVLEDLTTTYDCLGRITSKVDAAHQTKFFRGTQAAPRRSYWYDSFGRLIKATGRETIQTGSNISRSQQVVASLSAIVSQALPFTQSTAISNYTEAYTYDDADNIQSIQHQSSDSAVAGWKRTYEYNESSLLDGSQTNNRLSQTKIGGVAEEYKYEGDAGSVGCMTSMPGFSRLGWDCNNRLSCSARQRVNDGVPETTWYIYNEDGRRMRKVVARTVTDGGKVIKVQKIKETIFLDSLEIYHTYNGDGQTAKTTTHTSLIDPTGSEEGTAFLSIEDSVLLAEGPAVRVAPLFRYHVSESLETDDRGQVISYEEYSPFGFSVLLACRSDIEAPRRFRFAAYERDNETGLYACGDRYYAPWLGRWTSADPIGTADGHNVYAYVRNDPVNWTDPTGNCKEEQVNTRAGFTGKLPVNNLEDNFTMAQLLKEADHASKSMVERAKLELQQNKGVYATKLVRSLLGMGADLIPVAGPLVKMVVNKLADIHLKNLENKAQQIRDLEHVLMGIQFGLEAAQKSNEKMIMEIGSRKVGEPQLTGSEMFAKAAARVLGTDVIDWDYQDPEDSAEADVAASVDSKEKIEDSSQQENGKGSGSVVSNKSVGQKFYRNLLKDSPSSP
jgi:RHS repeat-associated protein